MIYFGFVNSFTSKTTQKRSKLIRFFNLAEKQGSKHIE